MKYFPTKDMIVDIVSKALTKDRHQAFIKAMGLKSFDHLQSASVECRALDCSWSIEM